MIPFYLKRHPQFNSSDYEALNYKGYTNREIRKLWDNEFKNRYNPITINKYKFDFKKENQENGIIYNLDN